MRSLQREQLENPITFLPGVRAADPIAEYWLRQVTLRLRREVCWLWRERVASESPRIGPLPPTTDRTVAALDQTRYAYERSTFFRDDVTARYLSDLIKVPPPRVALGDQATFSALVARLHLRPVECFVLALALLPCADSASGAVIATCLSDSSRTEPTLALAQRLWDEPEELLSCFDPGHVLLRHGVLTLPSSAATGWHAPLSVPSLVARELLVGGRALPAALEHVASGTAEALHFLTESSAPGLRVVPLLGPAGAPLEEAAADCAARLQLTLVRPSVSVDREHLSQLMTTAWLRGHALYVDATWLRAPRSHEHELANESLPLSGLPLWLFIGCGERASARRLAQNANGVIEVPPLSYAQRLSAWREVLPSAEDRLLTEAARRYRIERPAIARIGKALSTLGRPPAARELFEAARSSLDAGALAQPVTPRFTLDELMLGPAATRQIGEIVTAVRNLARAHYEWGTGRAWNECGLTALFAGPPGTGKTMCAEAISAALLLPLYRIDLSQVVDKYVGQTEKNLRQLFDSADATDAILFFDEADALFGRRTSVRDAHDRYANLEVSYLLERMERFRGLALLATNRRRDLDEAFLRRLRFVVDFEMPGAAERLRIWRSVIPESVDASALDMKFLAERFALSGGHIRAIVFQACLQCAAEGAQRVLTMPEVVRAIQSEYQKLERAQSAGQFGRYAALIAES